MHAAAKIEDIGLCNARGDQEAVFLALVDSQRAELHSHCYRMLGSFHDADDALQDTLLRAWRALPRFRGHSSLRTWLYRIATNVCLDAIARRQDARGRVARAVPRRGARHRRRRSGPPGALRAARGAGAGVYRGAAAPPAAPAGGADPARRARLHRSRGGGNAGHDRAGYQRCAAPRTRRDRRSAAGRESAGHAARARRSPAAGNRGALRRFIRARRRRRDPRALLIDDATFSMPPYPQWCQGPEAIAESWLMPSGPAGSLRYTRTSANGQPALGTYRIQGATGVYVPIALDVLTLRGELIADVTAFREPATFARFDLPVWLGDPPCGAAEQTTRG